MTGANHIRADLSLATEAGSLCAKYLCVMWVHARRGVSHHIKDELIGVKVGLLNHAADDASLDDGASTFNLQAWGR